MCGCAHPPAANDPHAIYPGRERSSKKTLQIAELGIGGGLAASAFGGAMMGVGKAVNSDQGEVTFWMGVGTLSVGIVSSAISLVVLTVAGVQYAGGD